jgi:hypothetical protein
VFKLFAMPVSPAAKQAAERAQARLADKRETTSAQQAQWARSREVSDPQTATETTRAWANRLASNLYPGELLERYPRVANRLALCWSDAILTSRLFDSLLQDRRGGRKGFPDAVKEDLLRLCRYHNANRAVAAPSDPWSLLATSDR